MGLLMAAKSVSLKQEGAAFLTAAIVARSRRIETTTGIVELWRDLQTALPVKDDIDFVSAVLVGGRLMDLKKELRDPDGLGELMSTMRRAVEARQIPAGDGRKAITSAFLTSAYVTATKASETTSTIARLWADVYWAMEMEGDVDIVPALLGAGRASEIKRSVQDIEEILDIYQELRKLVRKAVEGRNIRIRNREIVTAFLTSAMVASSSSVERMDGVVRTWLEVRDAVRVVEEEDILSVILASGRVRDVAGEMLDEGSLVDLITRLKERLVSS